MTQSETRPTSEQVTEFVSSLYENRDQEFDIKNLSLDELRALKEQEDEGYSEFIDYLAEGMCSMLDEFQVKVMIHRIDWSRSTNTDSNSPARSRV